MSHPVPLAPNPDSARRRRVGTVAPILVALAALGADAPREVRVRVPAAKVGAWFPPGTSLRTLPAAEFDALVDSARIGYERQSRRTPARLLRADHAVRWDSGVLIGRSELLVASSGSGPSELTLTPWTPAIDPPEGEASKLRMHDGERTAVRVSAASETVVLTWQLRARPNSQGKGFTLGLPAAETASLVLDLPAGWIPEGPAGIRQGPTAGPASGRESWRFDGKGGLVDLRFRDGAAGADDPLDVRAWVSGPTRIELGEASASWTTDWTVNLGPRGRRQLRVALDPGLEYLGATGPAVEDIEMEAVPAGTSLTIRFRAQAAGPTPVSIRAMARVPVQGSWAIPVARPLDALWTGGRTSVRLDTSRVLADYREEAGRRVSARPGEPSDAGLLVFESSAARSPATLVFDRTRTDVSVDVRGQLLLGNSAPRLECRLTWRVHRGRLLRLDVDLPPAWVPERVQVAGLDEALAWRPEVLPGGAVRVHAIPPSGDFARDSVALDLAATAAIAGGRGPLSLPRVRPVGGHVADERWIAWAEPGVTLLPTSARGLAWIDPAPMLGKGESPAPPAGLREALAWRWTADQVEARIDRGRVEAAPRGAVRLTATVDPGRLRLDWRISAQAGGEPLRAIPLASDEPIASGLRLSDEATGLELARRPLDPERRAALGLPETGEAWEVPLPRPATAPVALRAELDVPWDGKGPIPLLALPRAFRGCNLVVIDAARDVRSTVDAEGLERLDPAIAGEALEAGRPDGDEALDLAPSRYRRAHAFAYTRPGGRLVLRTEDLEPARVDGVIDQAVLTSFLDPRGPARHHLALRVAVEGASAIDLTLPDGATLLRARRDGQPVKPIRTGRGLSIPLAIQAPARTSSTLSLDYATPPRRFADGAALRPERPAASLPYLAFRWEVVAPEPWGIAGHGPGLIATDPAPAPWWPGRVFGPWLEVSWDLGGRGASGRDAEMLGALGRRVATTRPEEATLGEWLTRWDAGPSPLIIDRMALESAGWGPRSRVAPPRAEAGGVDAARAALRALGLTVVPVGETLLITTQAEAPAGDGGRAARDAWETRLAEATAWGSDASDRFQSVMRWRGENTPRGPALGESTEFEPVGPGWRTWRFSASGWPSAGVTVRLVDERRRSAWAWAAALAVLAAGIAARSRPAGLRAAALAPVILAASMTLAIAHGLAPIVAQGVVAGALAAVFYWGGRSLPRRARTRAREGTGSSVLVIRAGGRGLGLLLLGATALALAYSARLTWADGPDPRAAILALFPYDGEPDPSKAPDRAVLRLEDYERLEALARSKGDATDPGVAALGATHRVSRRGERDVFIVTECSLIAEGDPDAAWTFPVEGARNIAATLDGLPVPVQVGAGAQTGTVAIPGAGRHQLRIERLAAVRPVEGGDGLGLAINPLAASRVAIEGVGPGLRVEVPGARGRVEGRGTEVDAALGPVGRLEVRWIKKDAEARPARAGAVDGLILWDAVPAGDRVRARLTYRNPEGTPTLRLRLEPGLVVRPGAIPGLLDASWQGSQAEPEWVASVDPPLPDGATIELECWRPAAASERPGAALPRALPRIEPLGVERYSGTLGFRRPADWSGRLAAGAGGETITEEVFVRAWGNLPEEPLTLSGATRFPRLPGSPLSVRTGPEPDRLRVQPDVQLAIAPGRIAIDLKAALSELSGRVDGVTLELPAGMHIVRVAADGLTDWSRAGDRLLLRFDGVPARQRTVQVEGWIAVPSDPLSTAAARRESAVPWPKWVDAEVRSATLTVSASTTFQLDAESGVVPLAQPLPGAGSPAERRSYRVERPEGLVRLRWDAEPPRVAVQVRSHLTIHPDSAEWVAIARYDVSGGASAAIHLRLPAAWAAAAEVEVVGGSHQRTTETQGETTYWTIRPEHPVWGSEQLIVRAVRPFSGAETVRFPELSPLGRGAVDTYLAIANATGRELTTEGSPGLQPIGAGARFPAEEFAALPGLPTNVFHVRAEGWSLRVGPPKSSRPIGPDAGPARALSADVECDLLADGSVLGSAQYEVEPRSGPFLPVALPEGSEPLWASAGNSPSRPLCSASGSWLIPLDAEAARRVTLVWRTPAVAVASGAAPGSGRPVPLPSVGTARIPTFVTVRTPETADVSSAGRGLEAVTLDRLETSRAEGLGRSIAERLATIDRSSLQDREVLVSELVRFELLLRSAERAAGAPARPSPTRAEWVERLKQKGRVARADLSRALENAGLDEFARAARVHLGLAPTEAGGPAPEIPEATPPVRLRRLGIPHSFQGESGGTGQRPALVWTSTAGRGPLALERDWPALLGAAAAPLLAWLLVRREGRVSLLALLASLAAAGGPIAAGAALALALLGRFSEPAAEPWP